MKIIGDTAKGKIVEISNDELANLIGYYSSYGHIDGCPTLKVGMELDISKMYQRIRDLAESNKDLQKFALQLDKISSLLKDTNIPFSGKFVEGE